MKLGHDQFHHYTTRKITFESTPGLFLLDGVPLNRSTKHPASEDYFGDDASRLLPMLLAYKYIYLKQQVVTPTEMGILN